MKYKNFERFKFSTVKKSFNTLRYNFVKIAKSTRSIRIYLRNISEYFYIKNFNFNKFYQFLNIREYRIGEIKIKKINFLRNKFLFIHLPSAIVFFAFLYIVIPTFYNYQELDIDKLVCKNKKIECIVNGKIRYSFYPTPRMKIKDIVINDSFKTKKNLAKINNVEIKLSYKNLLAKEKHKFKKIYFEGYEINLDLENFSEYQKILKKKINLIPSYFVKGNIILSKQEKYISTIEDANIELNLKNKILESTIKGKFLDDNLYVNFTSKNIDNNTTSTDLLLKMTKSNFLVKSQINSKKDKNLQSGNALIKKGKNRITTIFEYKNNNFLIKKSNLKNAFVDGSLEGKIELLPFFDFNLDVSLSSLNFTKLYNYFLSLDDEEQKKLFSISKKINGRMALSADKIYSSYNLVKSFESRMKFYNGNISIEQFLINLGKLGATDILGVINNNNKLSNFKFESNIFVDNQKKFLSKFNIYNKKKISPNFFISGNFDLHNKRVSFYEISDDKKISNDDLNYIENEFNRTMLEYGYETLFDFPLFKDFIKSISAK